MIELGKYGAYVVSAYGITLIILVSLCLQTFISYTRTKKKLAEILQKKL